MRYIEAPDLHFAPQWAHITEQSVDAIVAAAKEHEVDFVALPGDIYDRSLQVSDKGGINHLRSLVRRMTAVAPVVSIYGTPSHEPPGSLEHLKDCGLTVLEPGKTYGLFRQDNEGAIIPRGQESIVTELPSDGQWTPDAVLFGIPELTKQSIQSRLSLPADEANAEATALLRRYIMEYVAPMRAKHSDIPAVGLLHGNISDSRQEHEQDVILRQSDILIHSEDLEPAGLDRWSLGHIHTPWESEKINAGYAGFTGIDGNPWGKIGFVPAMNLVDLDAGTVTRLPYGTPERRKIRQASQAVDPNVAYWLHTSDPNATLPDTVHPWSRVTHDVQRQETRRVTAEQAEQARTLRDLFKLFDPDASEPVLDKVDTIAGEIGEQHREPTDVRVEDVEVEGCTLFGGRPMRMTSDMLYPGLNGIRGDNGSGKSSTLAFWSPYPTIIGKDTRSGRASAIKDFFDGQTSVVRKHITCNGQRHDHVITIRGAHTQSPKTECYLSIDGEPQLETATFDEMFAECERLYGPYVDYLLTAFYVQPLQGKTGSSLMSATMTDIRDLVQNIAGIDRESEKRYALDQVKVLDTRIQELTAWLAGAREFQVDISALETELSNVKIQLEAAQERRDNLAATGAAKRSEYDAAAGEKQRSDEEAQRKQRDEARSFEIAAELQKKKQRIEELQEAVSQLEENREKIRRDDQARADRDAAREAQKRNEEAKRKYNAEKERLESLISRHDQEAQSLDAQADRLLIACENCGYINPEAQEQAGQIKQQADEAREAAQKARDDLAALTEPELEPVPTELPAVLGDNERANLQAEIEKGVQAQANITAIEERIAELRRESTNIDSQAYDINDQIEAEVQRINTEIEELRRQHGEAQQEVTRITSRRDELQQQITKAQEVVDTIATSEREQATAQTDREHWDYIARMLQHGKLPAMELELVLDEIDTEATRIIEPFEEGRYAYETVTQQQGKQGSVDRFDIRIHDAETGRDKSFLEHSPGEKAFLSDAYVKALVSQRNRRARRSYDPVIMDESDGPIQPERIAAYYEMQTRYWTDSRVLVVSHSPASHEHIEHTLHVEEIIT